MSFWTTELRTRYANLKTPKRAWSKYFIENNPLGTGYIIATGLDVVNNKIIAYVTGETTADAIKGYIPQTIDGITVEFRHLVYHGPSNFLPTTIQPTGSPATGLPPNPAAYNYADGETAFFPFKGRTWLGPASNKVPRQQGYSGMVPRYPVWGGQALDTSSMVEWAGSLGGWFYSRYFKKWVAGSDQHVINYSNGLKLDGSGDQLVPSGWTGVASNGWGGYVFSQADFVGQYDFAQLVGTSRAETWDNGTPIDGAIAIPFKDDYIDPDLKYHFDPDLLHEGLIIDNGNRMIMDIEFDYRCSTALSTLGAIALKALTPSGYTYQGMSGTANKVEVDGKTYFIGLIRGGIAVGGPFEDDLDVTHSTRGDRFLNYFDLTAQPPMSEGEAESFGTCSAKTIFWTDVNKAKFATLKAVKRKWAAWFMYKGNPICGVGVNVPDNKIVVYIQDINEASTAAGMIPVSVDGIETEMRLWHYDNIYALKKVPNYQPTGAAVSGTPNPNSSFDYSDGYTLKWPWETIGPTKWGNMPTNKAPRLNNEEPSLPWYPVGANNGTITCFMYSNVLERPVLLGNRHVLNYNNQNGYQWSGNVPSRSIPLTWPDLPDNGFGGYIPAYTDDPNEFDCGQVVASARGGMSGYPQNIDAAIAVIFNDEWAEGKYVKYDPDLVSEGQVCSDHAGVTRTIRDVCADIWNNGYNQSPAGLVVTDGILFEGWTQGGKSGTGLTVTHNGEKYLIAQLRGGAPSAGEPGSVGYAGNVELIMNFFDLSPEPPMAMGYAESYGFASTDYIGDAQGYVDSFGYIAFPIYGDAEGYAESYAEVGTVIVDLAGSSEGYAETYSTATGEHIPPLTGSAEGYANSEGKILPFVTNIYFKIQEYTPPANNDIHFSIYIPGLVNILVDTLRKINPIIFINSDTFRSTIKDIQVSLDTNRKVNVLLSKLIDTFRIVNVFSLVNTDLLRRVFKSVSINSDSNRRISKFTQILSDTLRQVITFGGEIINVDTLRKVVKPMTVSTDTKRIVSKSIQVASDSLRYIINTTTVLSDTVRQIIAENIQIFNADTRREVIKSVSVNIDLKRRISNTVEFFIDTLRVIKIINLSDINPKYTFLANARNFVFKAKEKVLSFKVRK